MDFRVRNWHRNFRRPDYSSTYGVTALRAPGATATRRGRQHTWGPSSLLLQGLWSGASKTPSQGSLEFQRNEDWMGLGLAAGAWAHGLSRRRVPGHFSHRKGTRRRVKVAVKV